MTTFDVASSSGEGPPPESQQWWYNCLRLVLQLAPPGRQAIIRVQFFLLASTFHVYNDSTHFDHGRFLHVFGAAYDASILSVTGSTKTIDHRRLPDCAAFHKSVDDSLAGAAPCDSKTRDKLALFALQTAYARVYGTRAFALAFLHAGFTKWGFPPGWGVPKHNANDIICLLHNHSAEPAVRIYSDPPTMTAIPPAMDQILARWSRDPYWEE